MAGQSSLKVLSSRADLWTPEDLIARKAYKQHQTLQLVSCRRSSAGDLNAHVWPSRVESSLSGARMSHSLMLLSTEAVASTQSLYLHQSADRIS